MKIIWQHKYCRELYFSFSVHNLLELVLWITLVVITGNHLRAVRTVAKLQRRESCRPGFKSLKLFTLPSFYTLETSIFFKSKRDLRNRFLTFTLTTLEAETNTELGKGSLWAFASPGRRPFCQQIIPNFIKSPAQAFKTHPKTRVDVRRISEQTISWNK